MEFQDLRHFDPFGPASFPFGVPPAPSGQTPQRLLFNLTSGDVKTVTMHEYRDGYNTLYDAGGNEVDFDDEDCKFEEDDYSENEDTIEERCSISASSYSFKINEE